MSKPLRSTSLTPPPSSFRRSPVSCPAGGIVGIEVLWPLAPGAPDLCLADLRFYDSDDMFSDIVLQIKNVLLRGVESARPKMCPRVGINELGVDAHTLTCLANATLKYVA